MGGVGQHQALAHPAIKKSKYTLNEHVWQLDFSFFISAGPRDAQIHMPQSRTLKLRP